MVKLNTIQHDTTLISKHRTHIIEKYDKLSKNVNITITPAEL